MSEKLRRWLLPVAFSLAGANWDSIADPQERVQPQRVEDPVAGAIAKWELETGVKVSSTVKRDVGEAFRGANVKKEISKLKRPRRAEVLSAGVTEYLSDIRDTTGTRSIEAKTLQSMPAERAAAEFTRKLAAGPVGRLVVTSKPPNAGIMIDRQAKGLTDKTFVVSAGTHSVAVKMPTPAQPCSREIDIAEGSTVGFSCPEPSGK